MLENEFYKKNIEEIISQLKTSYDGLSESEARERLKIYGKNEINKPPKIDFKKFVFDEFKNPFVIILSFAFLISLILKYEGESILIFAVLLFQLTFTYGQKYFSYKSLKSLYNFLKRSATVKRDGVWKVVDVADLVLGDIVKISYGDQVPADLKLFKFYNLLLDESILTGESFPVKKDDKNDIAFAGSLVKEGEGEGVVIAVGKNTYFGKIEQKLKDLKESQIWEEIWYFLKIYFYFVIFLSVFILFFSFINRYSLKETLIALLSIFIGSIPEGLPFSINLMVFFIIYDFYRKKILTKNIFAIEKLGKINLILTDKTGTLTEGKYRIEKIFSGDLDIKYLISLVLNTLNPKSFFYSIFLNFANENKITVENLKIIEKKPFESISKYEICVFENKKNGKNEKIHFVLGAPDVILNVFKVKNARNFEKEILNYSKSGYRILGFGIKKSGRVNLNFKKLDIFGFFVFSDKVRFGAKRVFEESKKLGIDVLILTGDFPETAKKVAKDVGLEAKVLNFQEYSNLENIDDLKNYNIFARVSSFDKFNILKKFKEEKRTIAMVGDGVNDALSVKESDVGFALNYGADVTKEVSDFILMENNLENINYSILKGKLFLSRIRKIILAIFALSLDITLIYFLSSILNLPRPLYANQILFINIIEDTLLSFIFLFAAGYDKSIQRALDREFIKNLIYLTCVFLFFSLAVYVFAIKNPNLQTIYFTFSFWAPLSLSLVIFSYDAKKLNSPQLIRKQKNIFLIISIIYLIVFILTFKYLKNILYLNLLDFGTFIFIFFVIILLNFTFWFFVNVFRFKF